MRVKRFLSSFVFAVKQSCVAKEISVFSGDSLFCCLNEPLGSCVTVCL